MTSFKNFQKRKLFILSSIKHIQMLTDSCRINLDLTINFSLFANVRYLHNKKLLSAKFSSVFVTFRFCRYFLTLTSITDLFAIIKILSELFDLFFKHIMEYRQEKLFLKKISRAGICLLTIHLQTPYYVPNVSNLNLAWDHFTIAQCNFHSLICPAFMWGRTV